MNARLGRAGCLAAALLALPAALLPGQAAAPDAAALRSTAAGDARVIVKYRDGAALLRAQSATGGTGGTAAAALPQHAAAMSLRLGLVLRDGHAIGPRTQALRGQGIASADLAQRLAEQPDVEWAVPDERRRIHAGVPNDPYYGPNQTSITPAVGQWYLRAPDSTAQAAINAPGAWALTPGRASVTVAVLDTGVRFDHPDLAAKLYPGYDFVTDTATANDGDGRDADPSDPGDATRAGECSAGEPAETSSWHGTETAGLIGAATDNGIGIAGVGRDVMILPVRVLGKCGGYDSDILAAMRWAAGIDIAGVPTNTHPARVINMSLGSTGNCPASYRDVIADLANRGVSVVVSAGNDVGLAVSLPANCAGAIAVGGLRHVGTKVGYSNVGPEITVSAPAGNCVNLSGTCLYPLLTTTNAGTGAPSTNTYSDGTRYTVGTSFSAPLVAGTVALMLSLDSALTPAQIAARLRATARAFPGAETGVAACHAPNGVVQDECWCTTSTCGAGMLDAAAAVAAAVPAAAPPPTATITAAATTVTAGQTLTLSGATSAAGTGRSIAGYRWAVTDGAALASISGSSTGSTVVLAAAAAGSVSVTLTVTDNAGATGSSTQVLTVQAAPVPQTPAATGGGGGGGGGGAVSLLWAALLAAAVGALRRGAPA